jgi:hypothetical protein
MAETREEWIKRRAYSLWEEEGHPTGRDTIHWEQAKAEREALEKSAASFDGNEIKTKPKRTTTAGKTTGVVATAAPKKTVSRKSAS